MTSPEPHALHSAAGARMTGALQMEIKRAETGEVEVYWQLPLPRSLHQARVIGRWMARQYATIPKGRKVFLEVRPRRRPSRWTLIAIGR